MYLTNLRINLIKSQAKAVLVADRICTTPTVLARFRGDLRRRKRRGDLFTSYIYTLTHSFS